MCQSQLKRRPIETDPPAAAKPLAEAAPFSGKVGERVPSAPPPFTIGQLRRAIPAHCFERSYAKSFAVVAIDLACVAALVAFAVAAIPLLPPAARPLAWCAYWFLQGAVCTGLWVVAHECGHGAFSPSEAVNDAVGFVLHSLLLVPYWSWKHSHRRHHSNTGSTDKDEVFVPPAVPSPDAPRSALTRALRTPLGRAACIVFSLTLGWPSYLAFNVSGRPYPGAGWVSHYNPDAPIFSKRERAQVAASDAGVVAALAGLYALGTAAGFPRLAALYGVPLLIVNGWLVLITLLQHTHPALPHYTTADWDWLRGALSTVDRSYGAFLDAAFHHIADTHVAHHLFSQIPHYHAQEATAALKKVLGPYYARDTRPIWKALWSDWRECHVVAPGGEGDHGALWFHR